MSASARPSFLRFEGITKTFPGIRALDAVSFGVAAGSVHALMGENGAGKSTILKILSGAQPPTEGRLVIDGAPCVFQTTAEAIAAGVAVIYQELHLVPEMSVAENLYLGHLPSRLGLLNRRELNARAAAQLAALGEAIDPRASVGSLPIAQRQMVEIAKALTRDARVIAFDEPTSSLSAREVERLFAVIRGLRDRGRAILYVSHRMDEIEGLCDAATVLRDGKHVATFDPLAGTSRETMVRTMVGRPINDMYRYTPRPHGETVLDVRGVIGPGLVEPSSFSVKRGEIVGFFGLVGAGRTELLRLVFGATKPRAGEIVIDGERRPRGGPSNSIRRGLVLLPEDRKKDGIVPLRSVTENINLAARRRLAIAGTIVRGRPERENAKALATSLGVRAPSLETPIAKLSGGNQQKAILARWLGENVKVVLLDEPTRGIDVGAKSEIYSIIYQLAARGVGVVVVSSELPEVLGICDRVIVMREGAIVKTLSREEASQERVLAHALPISTSTRRPASSSPPLAGGAGGGV